MVQASYLIQSRLNQTHITAPLVFGRNLGLDQNCAVVSCFRNPLKHSGIQTSLIFRRFQTCRTPFCSTLYPLESLKTPPVFFAGNLLCPPSPKRWSFFKCFFQFPLWNCEAIPWPFLLVHPPAPLDSRLTDCCAGVFSKHSLPGESPPVSQWAVGREVWTFSDCVWDEHQKKPELSPPVLFLSSYEGSVVCGVYKQKESEVERMRLWWEAEAEKGFVVSSHILMPNKTILLNAAEPRFYQEMWREGHMAFRWSG